MSLSIKDKIFVMLVLAAVTVSSLLLYREMTGRASAEGLREIGTVTYRYKRAERKFKRQVIWQDIDQNEPVYNYDSIRTVEGATAHIMLKDGTSIDIDENTLILLSMAGKKVNIGFEQGRVSADTSKSSGKEISLQSRTSQIRMKGGRLSLAGKKDRLAVNVSSGSAEIRGKSGSRKVAGGMKATVDRNSLTVKKVSLRPEAPGSGSFFVTRGDWHPVTFQWKKQEGEFYLDVSTSPTFKNYLFSRKAAGTTYKRAFVPGIYYWRLRSPVKGEESEPAKFTVLKDNAATVSEPAEGREFSYHATPPDVAISWEKSKAATSCRLEVATDRGFKNIIKSHTTRGTRYSFRAPKAGWFYCRVVSLYAFSPAAFAGPVSWFRVKKTARYRAPEPVSPAAGSVVSLASLKREPMILSWQRDHEAASYVVEVSRDKKFTRIIHRAATTKNYDTLDKKLAGGKYFWRVRAVSSGGEKLSPSKVSSFSVSGVLPVKQVSPKNGESLDPKEGRLVFQWKDANRFASYRLELYRGGAKGRPVLSRSTENESIAITGLAQGTWHWRVVPTAPGAGRDAASAMRSLVIRGRLPVPEIIAPGDNRAIDVRRMKALAFAWKPVKGATAYEISIYRYRGFYHTKLLTRTSYSDRFYLKDFTLLDIDSFMWEVRALKKDKASVSAVSPPAKGYFRITLGEASEPEKIRITNPGVIYVE